MDRLQNTPFGNRTPQSGGGNGLYGAVLVALLFCTGLTTPAFAQSGEKSDSVGEDAVDAVTQPLSDLNLRSRDIPEILLNAQAEPYEIASLSDCDLLRAEVARLNEVLAPDADAPPDEDGLLNKGLKAGGNVLGGLIPFRGLVRQISGAEAQEARWQTAIYAGVARRSYLKGYAKGQGCETAEEASIRSARELLGLPAGDTPQSD